MSPLPTTQISVKANTRCCLFLFLPPPLISVFSVLVSKPQCVLSIAFKTFLVLYWGPPSHHLHRWKILTLFGVSSPRVFSVALLLVLLCFWSKLWSNQVSRSSWFNVYPLGEAHMSSLLNKRPRIPYSMSPIQKRNDISRCHGKRYCEPAALVPGVTGWEATEWVRGEDFQLGALGGTPWKRNRPNWGTGGVSASTHS